MQAAGAEKIMRIGTLSLTVLTVGYILGSGPVSAAVWNTNTGSSCSVSSGTCWGNTRTYNATTGGNPTLTASAWSSTVGSANTTIQDAYLGVYSGGLGVTNRDYTNGDTNEGSSPEHAMDNEQRFDSILFNFTSAVQLTGVKIGWYSTDSDISVLAYTGPTVPAPLAGLTYAQLTSNGWSIVGNYSDLTTNVERSLNNASTSSSYWLIAAYNSTFGETWTTGNDFVKVSSVSGVVPPPPPPPSNNVPEPQTALLMAIGLLGLWRLRVSRT
ncbi:MAG: PEP-CTERM sorting domain-containing protein [Burkholderiales bacterium]|nr:PEP-CTERM sorting domain-containing protein [Burkholderiales bacterium]